MNRNSPADLYLDLLRRSLTNTIFDIEPDIDDDEFRFTMQRVSHYVNTNAVSMIPLIRFDNIKKCILDILRDAIPGDLIEAGVWRGGAVIFMRAALKAYGVLDRLLWAADSFEGLPEPIRTASHSKPRCSRGLLYKRLITTLRLVWKK